MSQPRRASTADLPAMIETVASAFAADPAWAYLLPRDYPRMAPLFADAIISECLLVGEVWTVDDGQAVAAWLGPTPRNDGTAWTTYLEQATPDAIDRIQSWDQAVGDLRPAKDHWYLDILAVHPNSQGNGLARTVLTPILERCDVDGLVANLETSTPGNLPMYERFGFVPTAQIEIVDGPPVWFLQREPRITG